MKNCCLFFRMGALMDVEGDHVEIAPRSSASLGMCLLSANLRMVPHDGHTLDMSLSL